MLKLNVLNLLEKKGKTKYWLYKQLGMSYQNFNKMVNNQTNKRRMTKNTHNILSVNQIKNTSYG